MAQPPSPTPATIPPEIAEAIQRIDDHLAAMRADLQQLRADLQQLRLVASDLSTAISDATHRYNRLAAALPDKPVTYER